MSRQREHVLYVLMGLNLALQLFDGVATFTGVRAGFAEGNPVVAQAIALLGPATALWVLKAQACACLCLVWSVRRRSVLAAPALAIAAMLYLALSAGPWSAVLASLYIPDS